MISKVVIAAAIVAVSLKVDPAAAQGARGILTGVVKDVSGGALPGVAVTVTSETTRASVDAITNGDGVYTTEPVVSGSYRVTAALDGFEAAAQVVTLGTGEVRADITMAPSRLTESVVVTARRVEEAVQDVPIPVSVIKGDLVADAGAFNVNRMKEMLPTVQFYSTNPRNSAINIRGLGAPFGLTNDGIEPGVGLYIDGVFFARPAAATRGPSKA